MKKQTRLNVNINQHTEKALRGYAFAHQTSVTEAIRIHVGVAQIILDSIANGETILIQDKDGQKRQVSFYG